MTRFPLLLLVFSLTRGHLSAQTLITDMGSVRFFNTLDSAKSLRIMALAQRCSCVLRLTDSTHSMLLKLDLETDTNRTDTAFYRLDYNILNGDFTPSADLTAPPSDSLAEQPGIYIRIRDSVIRDETVIRLVDYGIHHYDELKRNKQNGEVYGNAFVYRLIAQKPSLKHKRVLTYCR